MDEKSNSDSTSELIKKSLFYIKEHFAIYITLSFLICSAVGYLFEYLLLSKFSINVIAFAEIDDFFLAAFKFLDVLFILLLFPAIIILVFHAVYLTFVIKVSAEKIRNSFIENNLKIKINGAYEESNKNLNRVDFLAQEATNHNFWKKIKLRFYLLLNRINFKKLHKVAREQVIQLAEIKNKYESLENELHVAHSKSQQGTRIMFGTLVLFISYISVSIYFKLQNETIRIIENPTTMATVQLRNKIKISNFSTSNNPLVFISATNKFMFFFQHGTSEKISTLAIPISSIVSVHYSDFRTESTSSE